MGEVQGAPPIVGSRGPAHAWRVRRLVPLLAVLAVLGAAPRARADATGLIFTVAGSGVEPRAHDGEAATSAGLTDIAPVAALPDGDLLIGGDLRVWRLGADGRIHAVAGTGRLSGPEGGGGPALRARMTVSDLAALPGGGFLILDDDRIRLVDPQGRITTVAGGGRRTGDGVPATEADIGSVNHLAAAPDGSFVFDEDASRVVRVGPDGRVRTIAGNGRFEESPAPLRGQPATTVPLEADGLAVAPDGSVLISDGGSDRVERVTPDGAIHLAAAVPGGGDFNPGPIAVYPDGDLAVLDVTFPMPRVWRFAPDGTAAALAGTGPPRLTTPAGLTERLDGEPARRAVLNGPDSIAVTPDGGVVVGDESTSAEGHGGMVRYVAPATPGRLAVAVLRDTGRILPTRAIGVALTLPATVAVGVAGHTTTLALPAGVSEVPLPGPLPTERALLVRVTATDATGRRAFDRAHLYPQGWLPAADAQLVISTLHPHAVPHGCRRVGPGRMDCGLTSPDGCRRVTVELAGGRLRTGTSPCRHPRAPKPLRAAQWTCERSAPFCSPPWFGRVTEADLLPSD
jgi:sugar lactone lactonase YvrE